MHSKTKFPKHILLWCSPGFGVLDIWLPVIRKLKEKGNIKIDFIFPEPSSIRLEDKSSSLFNFAELVLGVSNKSELEQNVESILNQYKVTLSALYSKYEEYYKPFEGSSEVVANDICRRIDDIKSESV